MLGSKVSGGGGSSVTRTFLSSDQNITNTGSTSNITDLSPSLGANKKYLLTWYLATVGTTAADVWRVYPSYPGSMSAFVIQPTTANPADQQNSLTPSNNTLATQLAPGLQIGDYALHKFSAVVETTTAGTFTLGMRYVVAGTGTIKASYSWVEVEEL